MSDDKSKVATKAGLMNKHQREIEPIEREDSLKDDEPLANDSAAAEILEDESIDQKLPRTGKHTIGERRDGEGLH